MNKSTEDLKVEASAMVEQDNERGMLSVYIIMATLADEKGLSSELRQDEFSSITTAMLAGEIPVYSRARRQVLQAPLKALGVDHIANIRDARRWAAGAAEGAYGTLPTAGAKTHQEQMRTQSPAPARPRTRASKDAADDAPTTIAAASRWAHLTEYNALALNAARSKTFASRAEAARFAAEQLAPKPKPKSKPNAPDTYYTVMQVDEWLKEAGWSAKMPWAEWVALLDAVEGDSASR